MQIAKQLLVEGPDDLHAIINLMRHHTEWPEDKNHAPVAVYDQGGWPNIIDPTDITTRIKGSDLKILGVVVDADENLQGRWERVRQVFQPQFADIPAACPKDGLIVPNDDAGQRLGVWIMPDCASHGMLETFLSFLVPTDQHPLWSHAQQAFASARQIGCPCPAKDTAKAEMHTWLAWQNPPGRPFGTALTAHVLRPEAPQAAAFVAWFLKLYDLPALADVCP